MSFSDIKTYRMDNLEKWKSLVAEPSNCTRIVNVLRLGALGSRNASGDVHMDIFPALEAIRLQAAEATGGNQWQRLVRGGIVETLCHALLDIPSFQDPSVSAHEENTGVLSSWYPALRVLSESSMNLSQSLSSATTKLFISTVKKNWTAITIRLWTDPQQSLDGIEYMERTMFAALTRSMLNADPSFLSIIDRENDLTISLLARYWVLSTADSDFITTVATIMDMIDPSPDTSLALYRRSHPKPPAATARILQSTKSSASLFFTGVSNLYGWINRTQCGFAVRAVFAITSNAAEAKPKPSPAFFKPLLCHKVFWKSMLGVLKAVGDEETADASSQESSDPESAMASAADKEVRDLVFMNVFRLLGLVLETGCAHFPKEASDFVKLLVRAKLFDVLDEVLPQIKQMPKVAASVGNLFSEFSAALEKDPSLRPVLHSQFPRVRTLRTLLDIAHGPLPNGLADHTPTFINSRNMTRRDAAATGWMMMHALEKKVKPQKECSRRGCSKRREAKCKDCAEAGYCGPECQKLDWMDHRLICGFKAINTREAGAFAYITYPKRFLDDTSAGDSHDGASQSTSTPEKPRELVTSRDLSDHVKKMRLEHEERAKELQRLEEESQALIDAGMANTYECAEEARRAEEDPNWTEELQREMERKQRERNDEWMARCAKLHEDKAAMEAWTDALIALAPDDSNGKDPMKSLLQQLANSRVGS